MVKHSFQILIFLAILVAFIPVPIAFAQQPIEAEVEFFIDTENPTQPFTVGDHIPLRMEIKHPADSRVILPQVETPWESFTVIDQSAPQTIDHGDGTATTSRIIKVALFATGQYQTPPLIVTHRFTDGRIEELATPVISVNIASVLAEDDDELRDLKAQIDLPVPAIWPWVVAITIAALIVTFVLLFLLLWWLRRQQDAPVVNGVPVPVRDRRPAHVIAFAELDRIERLNLPAQDRIKEHYSLVSDCLRRYIEGRYAIPAMERTTTELRRTFHGAGLNGREEANLVSLIDGSDLVKFARYEPTHPEVSALVSQARVMVEATAQPAPTEEDTPADAPPAAPSMEEAPA